MVVNVTRALSVVGLLMEQQEINQMDISFQEILELEERIKKGDIELITEQRFSDQSLRITFRRKK